jgi:hypothetical protein
MKIWDRALQGGCKGSLKIDTSPTHMLSIRTSLFTEERAIYGKSHPRHTGGGRGGRVAKRKNNAEISTRRTRRVPARAVLLFQHRTLGLPQTNHDNPSEITTSPRSGHGWLDQMQRWGVREQVRSRVRAAAARVWGGADLPRLRFPLSRSHAHLTLKILDDDPVSTTCPEFCNIRVSIIHQ